MSRPPLKNKCQLITYPNSLGGDLKRLVEVLPRHFGTALGGVHLLPFYPSSGDRGFAPLRYDEVDPQFGSWADIDALGERYDLMVDFMLNHLSRQSPQFQDFQSKKDASPFAQLFIRLAQWVPPHGEIPAEQLSQIYTRKPRPPYTDVRFADGSTERLWCTFDEEQVDLDLLHDTGRRFVSDTLKALVQHPIAMLRIDAFAYTTKKLGTRCFFEEPEVWDILGHVRQTVADQGVVLLPEVHEHHRYQLRLAEHGYWVYDFALPMLALHALYEGTAARLRSWLEICPRQQFTTLDTHDGLPVVDVVDLLSDEEIEHTRETLFTRGANVKRRYNTSDYQNLDIYQINCTYYSALGDDDDAYITARAIQFFTPGIPQVYYVGLLAGRNDIELVERTRVGRDINRHDYTLAEIEAECTRPVVQRLLKLMRWRNAHPAFDGDMQLLDAPDHILSVRWQTGGHEATLYADLRAHRSEITHRQPGGELQRFCP
ncbi:MAG: sucrose phosphorylase [Polyangiales bacterium]